MEPGSPEGRESDTDEHDASTVNGQPKGSPTILLWLGLGLILAAALGWFATRPDDQVADPAVTPDSTTTTIAGNEAVEADTTTTTSAAPREPILYVSPNGDSTADGRSPESAIGSLDAAFAFAQPGDEIRLLPGTYPFTMLEGVGGTEQAPIAVTAPEGGVVFDPQTFDGSDSLSMRSVQFIDFSGFTVRGGIHGTFIQASNNLTFRDMRWEDVGQEAVQINEASTDMLFEDCVVDGTGLREGDLDGIPFANFGEGFYIGNSNGVDPVARVTVRNCEIANTTAEAIDIKPGAFDILIEGNRVHDITTANSGAVIAGQVFQAVVPHFDANIVIRNNSIWNVTSTSQFQDGNAINVNTPALIYNNVMWNLEHRGILVESKFENRDATLVRIYNNTIWNAGLVPIEIREGDNNADVELINNIGSTNNGTPAGNIAAVAELFVDIEGGDFRLAAGSVAIDAGVEVPEVPDDRDGRPRPQGETWDLGAYEADAPAPVPTTEPAATTTTDETTTASP